MSAPDNTEARIQRLESLVSTLWSAVCCLQNKKKTPSNSMKSGYISASVVPMLQVLPALLGKYKGIASAASYHSGRDKLGVLGKRKALSSVATYHHAPAALGALGKHKGLASAALWTGAPILFGALGKTKSLSSAVVYPTSAAAFAGLAVDAGGPGNAWTNPGLAAGSNTCIGGADIPLTLTVGPSNILRLTGYGYTIPPGANITGVQLIFTAQPSDTVGHQSDYSVILTVGGVSIGVDKANGTVYDIAGCNAYTYGGAGNVWGATLTPTVVNDPTFGVDIQTQNASALYITDLYLSSAQLTVYYQ